MNIPEEAIEFYRKALGAEVMMLMRFKDSPEPHAPGMVPPGAENKVMHASFRVGDSVRRAPAGALHWIGRVDDQIKIGGHRIEKFAGNDVAVKIDFHDRLPRAVVNAAQPAAKIPRSTPPFPSASR